MIRWKIDLVSGDIKSPSIESYYSDHEDLSLQRSKPAESDMLLRQGQPSSNSFEKPNL